MYQSFLYWIFIFQIVHFQKILEGQCLNKNRLSAPLYILLGYTPIVILPKGCFEWYSSLLFLIKYAVRHYFGGAHDGRFGRFCPLCNWIFHNFGHIMKQPNCFPYHFIARYLCFIYFEMLPSYFIWKKVVNLNLSIVSAKLACLLQTEYFTFAIYCLVWISSACLYAALYRTKID